MNDLFLTGATPDECWPLIRDFHYSKRMPSNIQFCFAMRRSGGLFGDYGDPVAVATFSIPPTRWTEPVIELSRLVRREDVSISLSKLIAFSTGWLKRKGEHLAVSFADWTHEHHGGVYQASGWVYGGFRGRRMDGLFVNGTFTPGRTCNHMFGTQSPAKLLVERPELQIDPHFDEGKHLYWKPLTVAGKTRAKRLGLQNLPYPKPNAGRPSDERGSFASEAGASPAARSIFGDAA